MGCPRLANINSGSTAEQSIYYAISAVVLLLRGCVRLRTRGWRKLQTDDYIALWVLFCDVGASFFTVSSLLLGGTWLFIGKPEEVDELLECQVHRVRLGSMYNILNW